MKENKQNKILKKKIKILELIIPEINFEKNIF